ncbi:MAG: ring-cleaving dioxygenase [Opitutaceae bacterium]|nr:ring-cleaving dioxygenase [Opitutaceae bacterium]
MNTLIHGIHHVTAIASDPQRNVDFYAGLLGLRLVKKTVNFDDPSAYHLYYGDTNGAPGSIVTFFYWPGGAGRGRVGAGQSTRLSFSAAPESLTYWVERLTAHGVAALRQIRFGEDVVTFVDPDGIPIEIVGAVGDSRNGWSGAGVPQEHALRGLHTTELTVTRAEPTTQLLTGVMGYRHVRSEGGRARYATVLRTPGTFIDVIAGADAVEGIGGVGTIHHVAWGVVDDAAQKNAHALLTGAGFVVSPVRDRSYFRSIYYRERGGILFEIATDIPGFAVDEPVDSLGTALKLPGQFEPARREIEALLPPLRAPRPTNHPMPIATRS